MDAQYTSLRRRGEPPQPLFPCHISGHVVCIRRYLQPDPTSLIRIVRKLRSNVIGTATISCASGSFRTKNSPAASPMSAPATNEFNSQSKEGLCNVLLDKANDQVSGGGRECRTHDGAKRAHKLSE